MSMKRIVLWPVAAFALTACASQSPSGTAGTTVTTVPATQGPQGQQVVVVEPGTTVRGEVRHTVTGKVEGVDRNAGEISVKATDGTNMKLRLPPLAAATIREGDDVSLNVVVRPQP
jgi:hypothetical protein